MKKTLCGCLAVVALTGCGIFDKDPLDIEGERISVVREDKNIKPDSFANKIKIRLPKAKVNYSWSQKGLTSEHVGGHLRAGGNLDEIWDISFGEGSSKRNVLIATPVSDGRFVYTIDAEGLVRASNIEDGKKVWKTKLKPTNEEAEDASVSGAGIAVFGDKLYATTGFGLVFALDKTDGSVVWQQDVKAPIRIAPTVNKDLVVVQTLDNGIFAININSGDILWKDKMVEEATTMIGGAAPAYSPAKDLIVAAFSNGQVQAFKASTGTPLWAEWLASTSSTESMADITAVKANPIIDEDKVFAAGYNGPLIAIDIRTGAKIWQREIAMSSQPWLAGKFLFALTNEGDLVAINKDDGKIVWTTIVPYAKDDNKVGVFTSGPILANDALLVTSSDGKLFSVSPYNGRVMGVADIAEGVETSPILVDETLLIITKDAELQAYK